MRRSLFGSLSLLALVAVVVVLMFGGCVNSNVVVTWKSNTHQNQGKGYMQHTPSNDSALNNNSIDQFGDNAAALGDLYRTVFLDGTSDAVGHLLNNSECKQSWWQFNRQKCSDVKVTKLPKPVDTNQTELENLDAVDASISE